MTESKNMELNRMRNLLFTLRFDGTAYHGWQVQENALTVQQTFQDAAERICGSRDNVVGCSRTDPCQYVLLQYADGIGAVMRKVADGAQCRFAAGYSRGRLP